MQKKFKLQKVLEYRGLVLEQEKSKLAALIRQEQQIIKEIQEVTSLIQTKYTEMAQAQSDFDFKFAQMYEKYLKVLLLERRKIQTKLAEQRQLIQKQNHSTVEAYKKKTIMDKLETKHKKAYASFIETHEHKTLEDIVTTRRAAGVTEI